MNNKTKLDVAIEFVGFSQRDRTLFASLFKVSQYRPFIYREWKKEDDGQPVCLLIDADDPEGRIRCELESLRPARCPVIGIGVELPKGLPFAGHIKRPIRWAEVLHAIDVALNIPVTATADPGKAAQFSEASNELEIEQIDAWYDRSAPPKVFKSDPAVLVVDPDPTGGNYISAKLAGSGYRVDHVASAAEAIGLLAQSRYNCVIHEMDLPDKTGLELCALLKQRQDRRRTASIILTANQNPLDRVRAVSAGCDAFLNKPIQPQMLLRTLEKFLPDWRMASAG